VGHYVGSGKHRPDPEKLNVIQNLARPRTTTELRPALGMMSYYKAYIPNFAQAAKPLTDLTNNNTLTEIPWSSEQQQAFDYLKEAMCTSPIYHSYNVCKRFSTIFNDFYFGGKNRDF